MWAEAALLKVPPADDLLAKVCRLSRAARVITGQQDASERVHLKDRIFVRLRRTGFGVQGAQRTLRERIKHSHDTLCLLERHQHKEGALWMDHTHKHLDVTHSTRAAGAVFACRPVGREKDGRAERLLGAALLRALAVVVGAVVASEIAQLIESIDNLRSRATVVHLAGAVKGQHKVGVERDCLRHIFSIIGNEVGLGHDQERVLDVLAI
eukprot:2906393-Prymnesium_polylepis.2